MLTKLAWLSDAKESCGRWSPVCDWRCHYYEWHVRTVDSRTTYMYL